MCRIIGVIRQKTILPCPARLASSTPPSSERDVRDCKAVGLSIALALPLHNHNASRSAAAERREVLSGNSAKSSQSPLEKIQSHQMDKGKPKPSKKKGIYSSRGERLHRSSPTKKGSPSSIKMESSSSASKESPASRNGSEKNSPQLARTLPNHSVLKKKKKGNHNHIGLSPAPSSEASTTSDAPVISVTKTLAHLQSIPTNRSCAECRSPLLDSSQTFVSFTPSLGKLPSSPHVPLAVGEFAHNHDAFAPPGSKLKARSEPVDPALRATQLVGGFGVFVCAACGAAHNSLGPTMANVHSVIDTSWWIPEQVEFLLTAGGNARSWTVFERYMPQSWEQRRPNKASTHAQRQMFVRTKYDALAFLTPPGGPLAGHAWFNLVESKPELQRWATKELSNFQRITFSETRSPRRLASGSSDVALPSRLVDFFCVIGHSGKVVQSEVDQNLAERNAPEELCFDVVVTDCYPSPDAYTDMDFPEHVSTFVFPDGCRPSQVHQSPTFFTFVLTSANGQRLYGAAMHVYDDQMDTDTIRRVLEDSGYTVPLPWWLHDDEPDSSSRRQRPSEIVYIPKCLVVLSHYPFFDIWRRFLTQLYRITMVEAPLPVERYIANFVSEVPLPPLGQVEVKFGFVTDDIWSIRRPPVNDLPLANFSYLPLFSSLSVGNIMVVSACLMQEIRVALLSSHYALLGPVAEALLSLLFPFEWQGMYIPIMPFVMLDILDAPVPFLVGLHSRYLAEVPRKFRPKGVVFVNLDRDEVHLGFDDEGTSGGERDLPPRFVPELPEKDALKLKEALEEYGEVAYLLLSSKVKGRIFTGIGTLLQNSTRPTYAKMSSVDLASSAASRMQILGRTDKAYPDGQQLDPINGFLSEQGHTSGVIPGKDSKARSKARNPFKKLGRRLDPNNSTSNGKPLKESLISTSLLETVEPDGFSAIGIRNAFLRFFVSVFNQYEKYLVAGGSSNHRFQSDDFIASLNLPPGSQRFVSGVLATQMFQLFIQERKVNPSSPSILFFDESIISKNNRSKKTTLTTGGKQKTPFLDNKSMLIQEVFTPPSPSNWGLPGDGRYYHYGSFPRLKADLFGKVRPPKHWPQKDAGAYRTVAKAAALKQQELIAKAMGSTRPVVPTLLTSSGGRSNVRDMEWAIRVLSKDAANDKSRLVDEQKVESRASAQQQLLAARRKQGILIDIVITIQAYCRMYITLRRYEEHKKALVSLQGRSRRTSPKKEQEAFRDTVTCAVTMQALIRLFLAKHRFQSQRRSTIVVQRVMRGSLARKQYKKLKAELLLQRWIRGSLIRCYVSRLRLGTIMTQSIVRGRRARFGCALLMIDISKAQALSRGCLTRKLVSALIKKRTSRFKQQIFVLWQHAHTPLAYRTKMWPLLDGSGFLSLTLAEGELERLWTELDIKFPPSSPRGISLIKDDQHLALAQHVGLSSPCYLRFVTVQAMIEAKKGNEGATPWFTAEGSPHWKKAAEREKLERLQIYERLHAETDKQTLQAIYNYFDISQSDKRKKRTLVDRLWDVQTHASRSVSVMLALFPELEYGTYMNFVGPSKKGKKLYHVGNQVPSPLDSSMQVEVVRNQLIKSNMKEFAMAHAEKVPGLLLRLDDRNQKKNARFLLQRRAEMYARRLSDWPRCRYAIIVDFLYPGQKKHRVKGRRSRT